ncbi:hypothetical protein JD77_05437 [Micromonospora olivasterospora]|uniref:Uncharacterized protein n=1 Tax=Micromonospora olivasterospora TaxID=1880 RepID=A0A562IHP3_MICOL|nr:hypothetical protein JD77_05437 [Micromonospora olivasterospora]
MAGTPSSTHAASSGEIDHSTTAMTAYATTAPTPGPVIVSTAEVCPMSAPPTVATSPAASLRGSTAPSRDRCRTRTPAERAVASSRTNVIVRCRMMPSQASAMPAATIAATQRSRAPVSCARSPSSTARATRYGRAASPIIHAVPNRLPRSTRHGWQRTSHQMYRSGPRVSGTPGSGWGSCGGIRPG